MNRFAYRSQPALARRMFLFVRTREMSMTDSSDRPADAEAPIDPQPTTADGEPIDPFVFSLPSQATNLREHGLWAAVLLLLTLVTFWPATSGQFIWDDARHVSDNKLLIDADGLKTIWTGRWTDATHYPLPQYYPFTHTSYWLEYHLSGSDNGVATPFSYHVTNIALHAISAILLWLILQRLVVPGAWVAAAVFALHPLNVESVAWISERKNVLAGAMFFGSILLYLLSDEHADQPGATEKRWGFYAAALAAFTLAMFSKTTACAMPAVMVLLLWWKGRLSARQWLLLAPFFVIGLVLGLSTAQYESSNVGAHGADWAFSIADRCVIAGRAVWFYVGKFFVPMSLTFSYPKWAINASNPLQYLPFVAAIAVLLVLLALVGKIGRAPFVAAATFVVCLFPALGFFNIYPMRWTFVADHYAYLASAVFAVALVGGIGQFFKGSVETPSKAAVPTALSIVLLLAFGAVAWSRTHVLLNSVTLWTDTVAKNPDSWLAHDNLGAALYRQGVGDRAMGDMDTASTELADAADNEQAALRLRPDDANAEVYWAKSLVSQDKLADAVPHFQRAIALDGREVDAMKDLAETFIRLNKPDDAIAELNRSLAAYPHSSRAHELLAQAYFNKGNEDRAIAENNMAIQIKPDNYSAREQLGRLLAKHGNYREAAINLTVVVKAEPQRSDIWNLLGRIVAAQGRLDVASKMFETALQGDPTNAEYQSNLDRTNAKIKDMLEHRGTTTRSTTRSTTQAAATMP